MDFGTRLKKLRKEKEISQEDFAKQLGVSRSSVGNYETNQNMPTAEILTKIASILDCSIDYILCKTDVRNHEEINIDEADIAFASGVKGLNETNKMIIRNTLEALLAKQEKDEGENK